MNNYQEFTETIRRELRVVFEGRASVEFHQVTKVNYGPQDALCIHTAGRNVAPVIYLRPFYEAYVGGRLLSDILSDIVRMAEMEGPDERIVAELDEWKTARRKIGAKLVPVEGNEELLTDIPHREFQDLALVYYIFFDSDKGPAGTAVISRENMEPWGVTEEDLYEQSRRNLPEMLPARIFRMEDMLGELLSGGKTEAEDILALPESAASLSAGPEMYVVTNSRRWLGAVALFYDGVLDHFLEKLRWEEAYVIPSSVHEMLLVPVSVGGESMLADTIREVNDTAVDAQERLTYSLYRYSRRTGCLTRAAGRTGNMKKLYAVPVA